MPFLLSCNRENAITNEPEWQIEINYRFEPEFRELETTIIEIGGVLYLNPHDQKSEPAINGSVFCNGIKGKLDIVSKKWLVQNVNATNGYKCSYVDTKYVSYSNTRRKTSHPPLVEESFCGNDESNTRYSSKNDR